MDSKRVIALCCTMLVFMCATVNAEEATLSPEEKYDLKIPPGYKLKPGLTMPAGFRPPPGFEVPLQYLVPIDESALTTVLPITDTDYDVIIEPDPVRFHLNDEIKLRIIINRTAESNEKLYAKLNFTDCYWPMVEPEELFVTCHSKPDSKPTTYHTKYRLEANFTLKAKRIGHCRLEYYQCDLPEMSLNEHLCMYYENWIKVGNSSLIKILREDKGEIMIAIYKISTFVTIVVAYFCVGCLIKGKNALEDLKRPLGPILGFVAQYLFMPVAAFSFGKLMRINPSHRVGLFIVGIVPSAWTTKAWVLLLDGDITFSLMITTLNTLASFGLIPFWIYVLTGMTTEDHLYFESLTIPWLYLGYTLFVVVGPTAIGFAVQRFTKGKITRCVILPFKIVLGILLASNVALTIYYFYDVIFMIEWRMAVCSAIFVVSGFLTGVLVGVLARRSSSEITVISIEAGIQNVYLARLILDKSLDEPENDVSSMMGIPVYLISHTLLLFYFFFRTIRSAKKDAKKRHGPPVHILRSTSYIDEPEVAIQLVEMNGAAASPNSS